MIFTHPFNADIAFELAAILRKTGFNRSAIEASSNAGFATETHLDAGLLANLRQARRRRRS
jgi:hypothetical protein